MFPLAATALEKIQQVPKEFWIGVGIVVVGLILAVFIIRKVAGTNKVILAVVSMIVVSVVGFNWIYERNEPKFLTPIVEKVAAFFPAKDSYNNTQKTLPKPLR